MTWVIHEQNEVYHLFVALILLLNWLLFISNLSFSSIKSSKSTTISTSSYYFLPIFSIILTKEYHHYRHHYYWLLYHYLVLLPNRQIPLRHDKRKIIKIHYTFYLILSIMKVYLVKILQSESEWRDLSLMFESWIQGKIPIQMNLYFERHALLIRLHNIPTLQALVQESV